MSNEIKELYELEKEFQKKLNVIIFLNLIKNGFQKNNF